jgi:LPS-assembly protein
MKFFKVIFAALLTTGALYAAGIDTDTPKTVVAPKIEYNAKTSEIKTTGRTEVSNVSGQRITLVDSHISDRGAVASGRDVEIWLGQNVYVTSASISRANGESVSKNAVFTACHGCDEYGNAWEISASKVTHDTDDKLIRFYNPVLWAYGLPVLWSPFLSMPDPTVKRQSGILMPDFESTNNMGTQFNLPVYIALSDTHDMTATLSYLTGENPLFRLEHRLNESHSEFRTFGSFTRNRAGEDRWHIFNDDIIELGENVRTTVYLERASDKTYLQKYGFYGDQPYLDSGAKVEMFGETGYAIADAHIFQELRRGGRGVSIPSGDILPNIRGTYQTRPLHRETYLTLSADILGISGDGTASQRVIGESKVVSPWTLWGGNRVTAALSARYDVYNFDNTEMIDKTTASGLRARLLPSGYLEWSLPMMKVGEKWKQIIEPRARLTAMRKLSDAAYAMNNDSSGALLSDATLFSNNRFAGLDLWENGTFADYGLRWSAFDGANHNIEVFLGQTYDFTDRPDTDPNSGFHNGASDYVGRLVYENQRWLNIGTRFRLSQDTMSLRHMETAASLGTGRNHLVLGHIWAAQFIDVGTLGDDIQELTAGVNFYLTGRFGFKFNAIYNMTDERFQRHSGGIFYDHPCYFLSLEYRRDNTQKDDYVGNTTFQFRFGMAINGIKQ